jgi:hypothetical protein
VLQCAIETARHTEKQPPNTKPEFGYHSGVSKAQESTKWVQVDLGRRVEVVRVVLKPSYDDYNSIGAGFGFPVRFKIEISDDPEFSTGVTLLEGRHAETFLADFPNPGVEPFTAVVADNQTLAGRYVRVTATKLAPRQNDFIFALAELEVFATSGENAALNATVTALDSVEAPQRWSKGNLVDGAAPTAPAPTHCRHLLLEKEALLVSLPTRRRLKRERP